MTVLTRSLDSLAETETFGGRIAAALRSGDAVLLEGPLGAGKSVLARAILRALLRDPVLAVPSPTFTLVQTYDSPIGKVAHFDLWRLDAGGAGVVREVRELGWDEAREGIVIVEWPDRLGSLAPQDGLRVRLEPQGETCRTAHLEGWPGRGLER